MFIERRSSAESQEGKNTSGEAFSSSSRTAAKGPTGEATRLPPKPLDTSYEVRCVALGTQVYSIQYTV